MPTTLQAVANYDAATVTLTVAGAPAGAVILTRTDANGTNTVRLRQGQVPNSGAMIVVDSEPALVGLVAYAATDATNATASASVTFDAAPPSTGATLRRNLLTNPSAETDANGWGGARGSVVSSASSAASVGAKVLHFTADGQAGGNYFHSLPRPSVDAGVRYSASALLRFPATVRDVHLDLLFFDASQAVVGSITGPNVTVGAVPAPFSVSMVAPPGSVSVQYRVLAVGTMAAGEVLQGDALYLGPGDASDYFDGDTPDTDEVAYAWSGTPHASESVALQVTGPPASDAPRVHAVQMPERAALPEVVTGYAATRENSSTVHRPINREDPVIVLGPTRLRDGRLTTRHRDYAAALALSSVLAAGPVMLRQADHPGLDMYLMASRITVDPADLVATGWSWTVNADYVETRSPNLPLLGAAGWAYDDATAGYPSYLALRSAFASYGALVVGP